MDKPQRTGRDQYYINSTGFEVYMVGGLVFVAGFSLSFILGVLVDAEWLVWPGSAVAIVATYIVLRILTRRERAAKIREVDGE